MVSAKVIILITKGDDEKFQFGYGAFEPLLIIVKVLFLFSMYSILAVNSIRAILRGGYEIEMSIALIYSVFCTILCCVFWIIFKRVAKKNNSPIMKAEAFGWFLDTLLSFVVLLAFIFVLILKKTTTYTFLIPFVDPFVTLCLIITMLPSLFIMFLDNIRELVAAAPSEAIQQQLRLIIEKYVEKYDFKHFESYSEKRGRSLYLIIHIFLKEEISIKKSDFIRKEMIRDIKKWWFFSDTDILFTINPDWIYLSGSNSDEKLIAQDKLIDK